MLEWAALFGADVIDDDAVQEQQADQRHDAQRGMTPTQPWPACCRDSALAPPQEGAAECGDP